MERSEIPRMGLPTGLALLQNPVLNKGTAFTEEERDAMGLRGLLPPRVCTQDEQIERILENFRQKADNLQKYIYLVALQDRNECLFYRVVTDDPAAMLPILYTPTVGEACQRYGHIYRRPRGIYLTADDRGRVARVLANWPHRRVRVIVVTDGERILGLGDLGANGMGIPVGKLTLYTACGGVDPAQCLPVTLDVGTDNQNLLDDPLYLGMRHRRVRGAAYDELLDEFMMAANMLFPGVLVQFEDFATANALRLLERNRARYCCFNDDIQGTGAVALAGLLAASRLTGRPMAESRLLFLGAGEAGIGIGEIVVEHLVSEGMSIVEARRRCWYVDSKGLVTASRTDLPPHKQPFAHEHPPVGDLRSAVEILRPTSLIGVSGQAGAFTPPVLEAMARLNERPVVFALSNPTSKSECTAEEAYRHTNGRAVFASGSPFPPVVWNGRTLVPGQGNNVYIFPGLGLGILISGARRVTEAMLLTAGRTLAGLVSESDLDRGCVYPGMDRIRDVSARIAGAVARQAALDGVASHLVPEDAVAAARAAMYRPAYPRYVREPVGEAVPRSDAD